MEFANRTPWPAGLLRSVLDTERIAASVMLRVTYRLYDGALRIAGDQPWLVSQTPWVSPQGPMEPDGAFMRGGVDLFVFGDACAPGLQAITEMDVVLEAGAFSRRARVTGDRVWTLQEGQLLPSSPRAWVRMPLSLDNAYGGKSHWDGLEVPFPGNPAGKGFCAEESLAEGVALPNLEEPGRLVRAWNDCPPVCGFGFCPLANSERLQQAMVLSDDRSEILDFTPRVFNTAFAPMVAPSLEPGEPIRLTGTTPGAPLEFSAPACPATVRLQFGDLVAERVPTIDQLGIEVDQRRVFVSFRFAFKYTVRPREHRAAVAIARDRQSTR